MLKRILIYSGIALSVVLITGGLAYVLYQADIRQQKTVCTQMRVEIEKVDFPLYLQEEDIRLYLQEARLLPEGKVKKRINSSVMEEELLANPYIRNADVYLALDDALYVQTVQRNPVLRVINRAYETYYIDEEGVILPVNPKYPLRTRLVNGNIMLKQQNGLILSVSDSNATRKLLANVFVLSEKIRKDPFLDAQIEQIYVGEKNEIELYPKIGGHTILFGNTDDIDDKLFRLKMMYKKGIAKSGWDAYSTINLKYKNQVVCTNIIRK